MALNSAQRNHFHKRVMGLIDKFYGDSVPTLGRFKEQRKATYLEQLKSEIDYDDYLLKVEEQNKVVRAMSDLVDSVDEKRSMALDALRETQREQMEALRRRHSDEMDAEVKAWEPEVEKANSQLSHAQEEMVRIKRFYYFLALGVQDDDRKFHYSRQLSVKDALDRRVGDYMKYRLESDPLGKLVFARIEEEEIATDIVYAANGTRQLKEMLERAARQDMIPQIEISGLQLLD